ncbi:MAG TPA: hypothetical protein VHC40_01660 [Rhizomicrobium sp.]|nr:hypothetical protein [Rhizomicrobium sp.]
MTRPVTAIVTGFTRNEDLCRRSLAPLRKLKRRGLIQRILHVTWENPILDDLVAPIAGMPEVESVRVPEPQTVGTPDQKGVIYQIRNLEAALALVPEEDAVILKTRPDFVAATEFLAAKIAGFETLCGPSDLPERIDVPVPASPFKGRIWLPWADSNQPFFFEDAAFMGLKCDVSRLADRRAETWPEALTDRRFGWFAHVVRFAVPFLSAYPIFARYLREFRLFPNDLEVRRRVLPSLLEDPFFWHLIVAHAWIMATCFHVDCGAPRQLEFYANTFNADADWSRLETLRVNPPYDDIENWRKGQVPGAALPSVSRAYGRLVDDGWATALFTGPVSDLTPENIRGVLRNLSLYGAGMLTGIENAFYQRLANLVDPKVPAA